MPPINPRIRQHLQSKRGGKSFGSYVVHPNGDIEAVNPGAPLIDADYQQAKQYADAMRARPGSRSLPATAPNASLGNPVPRGMAETGPRGDVQEEDMMTGQRRSPFRAPNGPDFDTQNLMSGIGEAQVPPKTFADQQLMQGMDGQTPQDAPQSTQPQPPADDTPDFNDPLEWDESDPQDPDIFRQRNADKEQRHGERDNARYALMAAFAKSAAQIGTYHGKQADTSSVADMAKTLGSQRIAQGRRMAQQPEQDDDRELKKMMVLAQIQKNRGAAQKDNWVFSGYEDAQGRPVWIDRNTGNTMVGDTGMKYREKAGAAASDRPFFHNVPGAVGPNGEPLIIGKGGSPVDVPGFKVPPKPSSRGGQGQKYIAISPKDNKPHVYFTDPAGGEPKDMGVAPQPQGKTPGGMTPYQDWAKNRAEEQDAAKDKKEKEKQIQGYQKITQGQREMENSLKEFESELSRVTGVKNFTIDQYDDINGTINGKPVDLPGFSLPFAGRVTAFSEDSRRLQSKMQKVLNVTIKDRSGTAVTNPEMERIKMEFASGKFNNEREMMGAIKSYKGLLAREMRDREAAFDPAIVDEYNKRGGTTAPAKPRGSWYGKSKEVK